MPRDLYFSRCDDEGNEYYGYLTVLNAAEAWAAEAEQRNFRSVNEDNPHEGPVVFAWHEDNRTAILVAEPNGPEDCYPSDALPFNIDASPFAVGDWAAPTGATPGSAPFRVVKVNERGVWVAHHAPWTNDDGLILPEDCNTWEIVPAPTVTYAVTVPADYSAGDVLNMLKSFRGGVTVTPA
jgi:hypothetical protein